KFPNSERLPLFQMIAKNAGIRRALAPFVLATNIDILLSDELFAFLGGGGLKGNTMYRVDRHDVAAQLGLSPPPAPADCRVLPAIREHTLRGLVYPNGAPATAPHRSAMSRLAPRELPRLAMAARDRLLL